MKLPHDIPCPNGSDRAARAKALRHMAEEVSRQRPHAAPRSNGEETDFNISGKNEETEPKNGRFASNFTKGLLHNQYGLVAKLKDYADFVEAINSDNNNLFVSRQFGAQYNTGADPIFKCKIDGIQDPEWRGWESARAGHVYELEGPDPDSVGMAPAPRIRSSEAAAEIAEVYMLALLRDVPFTAICAGGSKKKLCEEGGDALISGNQAANLLNQMPFYSGTNVESSTPGNVDESGLNGFERNRRYARTQDPSAPFTAQLTSETIFRGSTKGALIGPYISQFMLVGSYGRGGKGGGQSSFPGKNSKWDLNDGFINYGALPIDQRASVQKSCLDYMTSFRAWWDVQNGANLKGLDLFEEERRFITTPRDLATYVHFDALYEAYLNAVLILDSLGVPTSRGFPEISFSEFPFTSQRTGFATFGGPHILSLVTEVATRCLKAVRRQKFNFHRRCRPEAIAGRLTLVHCGEGAKLGCAQAPFANMLDELPDQLVAHIIAHNKDQNDAAMAAMRRVSCESTDEPNWFNEDCNLLLPMAFPEGSPMHPSYGAGHATVAGGCVTMIKAFFEMFEDCDQGIERPLLDGDGDPIVYVPNAEGKKLVKDSKFDGQLTIQGELDKLAANIAIGRNMAGVHFYSDYYDSLRLGERVAVGILLEQAPTYGDPMEMAFTSFDGDLIRIAGQGGAAPQLTIMGRDGAPVAPSDWWLRHVPGEQIILAA